MIYIKSLSLFFILILLFAACDGRKLPEENIIFHSVKEVKESKWEKLSEKRIYFGHQSVGFNIIEGLKDLLNENPQIKLNIIETNDPTEFRSPIFAHSRVGENMDPISKCNAFADFMEKGIGNKTDFAFFKFCFVDVTAETNIEKVFEVYKKTLQHLKKTYTKTTFIHVTVPLTTVQTGPKVLIKKIIGRAIGGYDDNIKRNQYNELVRKEYDGKEPIFDIAKIESTLPNGIRTAFKKSRRSFYSLASVFTEDGGHLNERGSKIVAEQLLILLASLT